MSGQPHGLQSMEPLIPFDSLSDEQQMSVLRYLQDTNTDSLEDAIKVVMLHTEYTQEHTQNMTQSTMSFYTAEQEQEITDYASYLREETVKSTSFQFMFRTCRKRVKALFRCLIPQFVRRVFKPSSFRKMYRGYSQLQLHEGTLEDAFSKGQSEEKCIALFVNRKFCKRVAKALNTPSFCDILNTRFVCKGYTANTDEVSSYLEDITQPCVIVAFKTILGQISIIGKHSIESLTTQLLDQTVEEFRTRRRHEKNVVIRYNNKVMSYFHDQPEDYLEDEISEESNYHLDQALREQQAMEYKQAEETKMMREREEQLQRERVSHILMERSIRKSSITDEPVHQNVVSLNFRCPQGNKLQRKFGLEEKVENIYTWVETNDKIEFQEDPIRDFELLKGYPPQPMSNLKKLTIQQAFEDKQQTIVIREN